MIPLESYSEADLETVDRDAEEALVRLQMEGKTLLEWMQWRVDCFTIQEGKAPTKFMLLPMLYRDYVDEIVGNLRWQVVTQRYRVDEFTLTFAGIPVVKGSQCLVI